MQEEAASSRVIGSSIATTRQFRCNMGLVFALVIADGLITRFLITQGLGQEWNPFLRPLAGEESLLLIKVIGALLSVFILWDIYRKRPRLATVTSISTIIIYTGLVYWNLLIFLVAYI